MLTVENVSKTYPSGVRALKNVNFTIKEGEFMAVIGLSGSGKSTLLRCLNRIHDVSSGHIFFGDTDMGKLKGASLRQTRAKIGMIFQDFNLIKRKTVLVNVLTGALSRTGILASIAGIYSEEDREKAQKFIDIVGLTEKERFRVDKLSGGQQQRTAIARAMMQNPDILLADEPVASLDPATSHSVLRYLKKINKDLGMTVICNLHFLSLVREYATTVIALKDGELVYQGNPEDIDDRWFKSIYGEDAAQVTIN